MMGYFTPPLKLWSSCFLKAETEEEYEEGEEEELTEDEPWIVNIRRGGSRFCSRSSTFFHHFPLIPVVEKKTILVLGLDFDRESPVDVSFHGCSSATLFHRIVHCWQDSRRPKMHQKWIPMTLGHFDGDYLHTFCLGPPLWVIYKSNGAMNLLGGPQLWGIQGISRRFRFQIWSAYRDGVCRRQRCCSYGDECITRTREVSRSSKRLASPQNSRCFAEWTWRNRLSLGIWWSCRSENRCRAVFGATFPEACCTRWTSLGSCRLPSTFWASGWRQPHCCCTAKDVCNKTCVCFVVCWRQQNYHVGRSPIWW